MATMSALSLTLALCVLQAQMWLARCWEETGLETQTNHCADDSLTFVTETYRFGTTFSNQKNNEDVITIEYGNELTVICTGANFTTLSMTQNGAELRGGNKTERSISWRIAPAVPTTEYVCTDTETNCKISVTVAVAPAFLHTFSEYEIAAGEYYIPYGNSMLLTCSGPDASQLVITKDGQNVLTETVNETTIEWFGIPDLQKSEYLCTDIVTKNNRRKLITVEPATYAKIGNETVQKWFVPYTVTHKYKVRYGDPVELDCSGSRPVEIVGLEDNKNILMEHVNETVKAYINTDKLGESSYGCVDKTSNYTSKIGFIVVPRLDVASPNIRDDGDRYSYVIKYGDPLEISCSGPDAQQLTLYEYGYRVKPDRTILNKTTITWVINKPPILEEDLDIYAFYCREGHARSRAAVRVDMTPELVDFHCISHDFQYLNCSWMAPRYSTSFTLYHQQLDGTNARICSKSVEPSQKASPRFCVWYRDDNPRYRSVEVLSFLMESCNGLGCNNQTYLIDHRSIVKADPIRRLTTKVYNQTSRSVVLQWFSIQDDLDYKVEYYSDSRPIEVDVSPVLCDYVCSVELSLPCPGQVYQVQVYQRLKKAVGEQFWSEPSSVTFETDSNDEHTDMVDPACVRGPNTCL